MFVVKQMPVCNFILLIFACVVLRKVHVHSLYTLETVGFPECFLFLDADKRLHVLNFFNFCASFVRKTWENHFICIYFSYRILENHSWSLVLNNSGPYFDRKWCPSVTEQSEGPMVTVASKNEPVVNHLFIWACALQNQQNDLCVLRRLRSAWASAQSDHNLRCPHAES